MRYQAEPYATFKTIDVRQLEAFYNSFTIISLLAGAAGGMLSPIPMPCSKILAQLHNGP
jgi:hypothetical protein